jgi:hypothetical protein
MNTNEFATFLKELHSAKNWPELKQKANEFASAINGGRFIPAKGDVINYHQRFKNSHLNQDKRNHEDLFDISKSQTEPGVMNT